MRVAGQKGIYWLEEVDLGSGGGRRLELAQKSAESIFVLKKTTLSGSTKYFHGD